MNKESIDKKSQNAQNLHFGTFLRKLRILSNKSFADIARANGRTSGAIFQQIEVGYSDNPTIRSLLAYAKGLEIPLSTLIAIWEAETDIERSVLWQLTTSMLIKKCGNFTTHKNCRIGEKCFCGNASVSKQERGIEDLLEPNKALMELELLLNNKITFDVSL